MMLSKIYFQRKIDVTSNIGLQNNATIRTESEICITIGEDEYIPIPPSKPNDDEIREREAAQRMLEHEKMKAYSEYIKMRMFKNVLP